MFWVIQDNLHHDKGMESLFVALDRLSVPYGKVKVVPFVGEIDPDISPEGNVMCIGSYSMRHVAKRKGWTPGVFDIGHLHHYDYPKKWRGHLLNDDAVFCSMKDVLYHFDGREQEGMVFLRPSTDSKFLNGGLHTRKEIEEILDNLYKLGTPDPAGLSLCTSMMVATPKNVVAEYRFWIVDGQVVTWSLYKRGDRVIYSSEVERDAISYVGSSVMEHPQMHRNIARAFVLDVARMLDGTFKIIEANTLNASGFYAADVQKLVMAIEDMRF